MIKYGSYGSSMFVNDIKIRVLLDLKRQKNFGTCKNIKCFFKRGGGSIKSVKGHKWVTNGSLMAA